MWLTYSFLMFLFSNLLYLAIRYAQQQKIAISIYSIGMFLIPSVTYFFAAQVTNVSLTLEPAQLLLVLVAAFFWSYLGNVFSQKGILYAPNPGYSLVIQKSYAIITTIAAVFLFGSAITSQKIIAIGIIIIFSAFISISDKTHRSQLKWIWFSIAAHLCLAFGSLISKQFLVMGLSPYQYLFYITLFVSVVSVITAVKQKTSFALTGKQWATVFLIGVFSIGFNLSMQLGYKVAPNPGYVAAINTSSIMTLTLLAALFFKDHLTKSKVVGILGVLVGLLLLTF